MIPDDVINQIRDAADIVAVVGQHVQLKKAGRSWKGLCPFHGEKTPSFNVIPHKNMFHCFGCSKNGDVFKFVMELEGKSFVEAVEQLGARFGVEVPRVEESPELRRARGERVAMLDLNKVAAEFYRDYLRSPKGEPGRAYLAKRGVSDETAEKFLLGYAPAEWDALATHLKKERADLEIAVKLGLIAPRHGGGNGFFDKIRERLVCPVIQPGGDVVGFSSRLVGPPVPFKDGGEPPKYINSPESTVYKKSKLLFGLAQAREAMHTMKRCVLVEGNFDVITLYQAGFTEVVAPLGTALTPEQVNQLKRLTDRVVLLYDGDRAGYKATMHALHICVENDVEVLVARRPGHGKSGGAGPLADGTDPDSLVAGGGAVLLREAVDRAQGGIEFFAHEVWGTARGNTDARARALSEAGRLLAKVADRVKRDLHTHTLATALGVDVGVVRGAIAQGAALHGGQPAGSRGDSRVQGRDHGHPNAPDAQAQGSSENRRVDDRVPIEELEVLALLADHPTLIATGEADKAFWLLTDPRLRDMYSAARDGRSLLELAPVQLPKSSAQHLMSGKYAEAKDPRAELVKMAANLGHRANALSTAQLGKTLVDASRRGDRERALLLTQLAVAERRGDLETVARIRDLLASEAQGKQVD